MKKASIVERKTTSLLLKITLFLLVFSSFGALSQTINGPTEVCAGVIERYTASTTGLSDYNWQVSAGGTILGGGSAADDYVDVQWSSNGTVDVDWDGGSSVAPTVNVSVNIPETPFISGPYTVCAGATSVGYTTNSGSGQTDYFWGVTGGVIVGGGGSSDAFVNVDWGSAGSGEVSVSYTDAFGCLSLITNQFITIEPRPVPIIGGDIVVCENEAGVQYTTESGNSSYTWYVSGGDIAEGGSNTDDYVTVNWAAAGSGYVEVSYISSSGCLPVTPTFQSITIEALPVPGITGSFSVCEYQNNVFYYTEAGQSNYNWTVSFGTEVSGGDGNDFVEVNWGSSQPGSVEITYETVAGCSPVTPSYYGVTINTLPVGAPDSESTCSNAPLSYDLQSNINSVTPIASTFEWYAQSDNPSVSGESTTSQFSGTIGDNLINLSSTPQIVVYDVIPTSLDGCTGAIFTITVTVSPEPVGNSGTEPAACSQTPLNINPETYIVNGLTGNNYSWSASYDPGLLGGAGTGSGYINETLTNTTNATLNGYYTVTPMSSAGCLGAAFTITVPIDPEPVGSNATTSAVCSGVALNVDPSVYIINSVASTFTWTATYGGLSGGAGSGGGTLTETLTNSGLTTDFAVYTITPTSSTGACAGFTFDITVPIDPQPDVATAGTDQAQCGSGNFILDGNSPTTGTGLWTVESGSATIDFPSSYNSSVSNVPGGTTAILRWTISSGACLASYDEVELTNDGNPTTASAGSDDNACGLNYALNANTPAEGNGSWSQTGGPGTALFSPDENSPTATVTVDMYGTYEFTWVITSEGTCPPSNDAVNITFTEAPDVANAGADQTQCNNDAFLVAGNTPTVGTGQWQYVSGFAGITFVDDLDPSTTVNGLTAGNSVTIRWSITNGVCTASTDEVTLTNYAIPDVANADADASACGLSYVLNGNAPVTGTGEWSQQSGPGTTVFSPSSADAFASAQPDVYGVYTYRWTITNGSCAASYDEVTITFDEAPTTANAGIDQDQCGNDSFVLAANTPTVGTGEWQYVSGDASYSIGDINDPATTVSGIEAGNSITLRWVISNGTCTSGFDDITLTNGDTPTTSNAGTDQTQCNNDSFTLSANTPTVGTGMWQYVSGYSGITITDPSDPNTTVTGLLADNSVTLRWSITSGGCTPSESDVTLANYDAVSLVPGANPAVCAGSTLTDFYYSSPTGLPDLYTIDFDATAEAQGFFDLSDQPLGYPIQINVPGGGAEGVYNALLTIRNSFSGCADASYPITVSIDGDPAPVGGSNQDVCGLTTSLAAEYPVSGTGIWSQKGGPGLAVFTDSFDPLTSVTVPTYGVYALRWDVTTACGFSSAEITVIFSAPITADAGADLAECGTTDFVMEAVAPGSGTGAWSYVSGFAGVTITDPADAATSVTGLADNNSVTLRWTITDGGCSSADDVVLSNYSVPAGANDSFTICSDEALSYDLQNNVNTLGNSVASTFEWTAADNANVSGESISAQTTTTIGDVLSNAVTVPETVVYTVVPSTANCTGSSFDVTLTIYPAPDVVVTNNTPTIANGGTVDIDLSGAVAGTDFNWTVTLPGAVTGGTSGTGIEIADILTNSGGSDETVTYTITPSANGCFGADQNTNVIVESDCTTPATVDAGADVTICEGSNAVLSATMGGASVVVWAPGGDGTYDDNSLLTPTYTPGAADIAAGTVTLSILTDDPDGAGPCTSATDFVVVTINDPATIDAGNDVIICEGSNAVLSATLGGASTVTWATGGDGTYNDNTLLAPTYTPSVLDIANGTVTLTISTEDPDGVGPCTFATDNLVVTINPAATASAGLDDAICEGSTYTLSASIGGSATSSTWSVITGAGTFDDASLPNATYTPAGADAGTTVILRLTTDDPAGSCNALFDEVSVSVNQLPIVDASADILICEASPANLSGSIGGSTSSTTWSIVSGDGTIDDASLLATTYTHGVTDVGGSATLRLTSDDPAGPCPAAFDDIAITVNPAPAITNGDLEDEICSGGALSFTPTYSIGGTTFTWLSNISAEINGGSVSPSGSTAIFDAPQVTGTTAGSVTYSITPIANGCFGPMADYVVTVNPVPNVAVVNNLPAIASGETTDIALSSAVSGATFDWTVVGSAPELSGFSDGSGNIIEHTLVNTGGVPAIATYTVTPTANTCVGIPQVTNVTVNGIAATYTVLPTDSLVLVDLYTATGGAGWTNNTNWMTGPADTWFGVTVIGQRVVSIALAGNNLNGTLPVSFNNLSELQTLILSSNSLTGPIPATLYLATNLQALDLSFNAMTGKLGASIGSLTNLQTLYLNNNQLNDELPIQLGDLTNLETLALQNNAFVGAVPASLTNLTSLTALGLFNNNLTSLPDLSSLPGGITGNVSSNYFTFESIEPNVSLIGVTYTPQKNVGMVKDTLMQTDATLQLQYTIGGTANQYAWLKDGSPIGGETTNMLTLADLAFEDEGVYQLQITNTLAPLLTLLTNPVTLHVSSLQRDSLSLVAIYNATGGSSWTNATNWLTGPVSTWQGVVVTNDRVVAVNLSNNNITGDIPSAITEMLALENLDLSGNEISSLPDLTTLPDLQMLDVSSNMLDFSSLEQNADILSVDYLNQADLGSPIDTLVRVNNEYTLTVTVGGTNNTYQWKLNNNTIAGATEATYVITNLSRETMGTYVCEITNPDVPGLVLHTSPNQVLAIAELRGKFYGDDNVPASGDSYVELFEVQPGGFPKRDSVGVAVDGTFAFDSVILSSYQIRATADLFEHPKTIPTYYMNTIFWEEADTIVVINDRNDLDITAQGGIEEPSPTATGSISGVVEQDNGAGRTKATTRVGNAGVSARRSQGTGRGEEEVLVLVAYVFTNENGEFLIDKLEPAEYLINIQYPGFPMDETSNVRVSVGAGPLNESVTVEATVADGVISVRKLIVTGLEGVYSVDVFPNPTSEFVNMVFERASKTRTVSLTDLKGHTVKHQNAKDLQHQLDVREVSNGLYVLTINEAGKPVAHIKLIVD